MKKLKNKIIFSLVVLILLGGGIGYAFYSQNFKANKENQELPLFTVKQGPLTISVVEAATINARDVEIIKSEVEGNTTVLWVIPEASRVEKGDKLLELDASKLNDAKDQQEISELSAQTASKIAEKTLEVAISKAESDIEQAELNLKFAEMDLKKYTDEDGEFQTQLRDSQEKIKIAEKEVQRTLDKYEGSKKLYNEKYISATELKSDEISWNKAQLDLILQKSQLDLLMNHTHKRMLEQLQSDVKQAEMALERIKNTAQANVFEAEEQLKSAQAKHEREKKILDKLNEQIEKTTIYAPNDGMVIYASSTRASWRSNDEPLAEGQTVHEREELFHLPKADLASAVANIHEANLDKIKLGMDVTIKVDAIPGEIFTGKVARIAPMPDARMAWMNPNLKVYKTEIHIDEKPGRVSLQLRTGMGCQVEIVSAEYENAVYVPIQTVITVGNQHMVYVYENKETKPRHVKIGEDNNRMVRIISGLEVGERVLMNPPLSKTGTDTQRSPNKKPEGTEGIKTNEPENEAGSGRNRNGSGQRRSNEQGNK